MQDQIILAALTQQCMAYRTKQIEGGETMQVIFDSTSRTFFITGVQLEVGDTATDFEHRTFGDELLGVRGITKRLIMTLPLKIQVGMCEVL